MARLFAGRAARSGRLAGHRARRADRSRRIPQWRPLSRLRGDRAARSRPCCTARSTPLSEPVVEWRALTVALLDRLASGVRERLGKSAARFSARLRARRRQLGRRTGNRVRTPSRRRRRPSPSSATAPCSNCFRVWVTHIIVPIRRVIMKTTIEISDPLLREVRQLAAREGVTLRTLVERGLHRVVAETQAVAPLQAASGQLQGRRAAAGVSRRVVGHAP